MTFEIFFNFNNGECRAAMEFYAKVFKSSIENVMLFSDAPVDPKYPVLDSELDWIMYASVKIADKKVMFMDMASSVPVTMGNNITPTLNIADNAEIDHLFKELSDGGEAIMAPQKVFFSKYYAMVVDKFGITWHLVDPNM